MASKTTLVTVAAVVATGVLAYAVYFDYKRRNDLEFRKKLKKEKKRVNKAAAQQPKKPEELDAPIGQDQLREALTALKNEPTVPAADRESFFMNQISMGEALAAQGPQFYLPAAIAFFRALSIYPVPAELLGIYQSTVHPPVFKLVIEMVNLDVTKRVESYFDAFPPKPMNVSIAKKPSKEMAGAHVTVVVEKDFAAGETIYKELPIVAALDEDLQTAGTHCTHCFRVIRPGTSVSDDQSKVLPSAYCSKSCLNASKKQSQNILFTLENILPEELSGGPIPPEQTEKRKEAQTAFVEGHKGGQKNVPVLTARFVARQVAAETTKLTSSKTVSAEPEDDFAGHDNTDYTLADHAERFRFVDDPRPEKELPLLSNVMSATLPGLEEFTTAKRYAEMANKMMYNAYGVTFNGGRDDRPAPNARPEDIERTRTPHGTHRQIGSAVYNVSAYLTHSCVPSARIAFPAGTNELHLIAERPLKKGDTVTIAFVDTTQHDGESVPECRRRRRVELARGWKFACGCDRCTEEASAVLPAGPASAAAEEEVIDVKDGAKVDEAVRNYELNLPRAHSPETKPDDVVVLGIPAESAEKAEERAIDAAVEQAVEQKQHDAAAVEEAVESAVEVVADKAAEDAVVEAVTEAVERAVEDAIAEVADKAVVEEEAKEIITEVAEQAAADSVVAAVEEQEKIVEKVEEAIEETVQEQVKEVLEAAVDEIIEEAIAEGKPVEEEASKAEEAGPSA